MTEAASAQLPHTADEVRLVRDDLLIEIEAVAVAGLLAGLSGREADPGNGPGFDPGRRRGRPQINPPNRLSTSISAG
jgi:hypothetical protein